MIPNAEATCLSPWDLCLLADILFPPSSIVSSSLISVLEYSVPSSSTSSVARPTGGMTRENLRIRQLRPSFVEPTTYSHYVWKSDKIVSYILIGLAIIHNLGLTSLVSYTATFWIAEGRGLIESAGGWDSVMFRVLVIVCSWKLVYTYISRHSYNTLSDRALRR